MNKKDILIKENWPRAPLCPLHVCECEESRNEALGQPWAGDVKDPLRDEKTAESNQHHRDAQRLHSLPPHPAERGRVSEGQTEHRIREEERDRPYTPLFSLQHAVNSSLGYIMSCAVKKGLFPGFSFAAGWKASLVPRAAAVPLCCQMPGVELRLHICWYSTIGQPILILLYPSIYSEMTNGFGSCTWIWAESKSLE